MRVVSLDISSNAGVSVLEGEMGSTPTILDKGVITQGKPVLAYGPYPNCYLDAHHAQAKALVQYVEEWEPEVVVVEETNLGKNRWSQKGLEFTHAYFLLEFRTAKVARHLKSRDLYYISSSQWRKTVGLEMSKEDKKNNAKLSKAKKTGVNKKDLGIKGKVTKKHLAVARSNSLFGLSLKMKDNDIADSLLLGTAYFLGAEVCDGT